jgi:hypothetical protein
MLVGPRPLWSALRTQVRHRAMSVMCQQRKSGAYSIAASEMARSIGVTASNRWPRTNRHCDRNSSSGDDSDLRRKRILGGDNFFACKILYAVHSADAQSAILSRANCPNRLQNSAPHEEESCTFARQRSVPQAVDDQCVRGSMDHRAYPGCREQAPVFDRKSKEIRP